MSCKEHRKAILFCTYRLWKGSTIKILEKELAAKGYETVLNISKKGMKMGKDVDFSEKIVEIEKVLIKQ